MSDLKSRLKAYDATITRAAGLIDLSQQSGAPLTAAQETFIINVSELARLAIAGAPDAIVVPALEATYTSAQAVIAELES